MAPGTMDNQVSLSGNYTHLSEHQIESSISPQFGSHNPPWGFASEPNGAQVSKRTRSPPLPSSKSNEVLHDNVTVARKDLMR